jgi:hypothetical protein
MEDDFSMAMPDGAPMVAPAADLSVLLIGLLKGVLYRDGDPRQWAATELAGAGSRLCGGAQSRSGAGRGGRLCLLKSRPEPADDDRRPVCPSGGTPALVLSGQSAAGAAAQEAG